MQNLLVGSAQHLELEGGLRDLEYLMLNLEYACNYSCSKCCNEGRETTGPESPLSIDEIAKLIAEAKDLGMRVLVIAGEGEPFLDPNIKEIIKTADKAGLIPYVFTNGSLLDDGMSKFLKYHNASLVINVDSLQKEIYESLTGSQSFEVVYRNLGTIRRLFSDTYSQINGYGLRRIAINMVVSHHNKGEILQMKDFCGDDFAFVCNQPMSIGNADGNPEFSGVTFDLETVPLGTASDGKWCAYMRNGISVGARGEVLICAYSLESAGLLGNVRQGGLRPYIGIANPAVDAFYEQHGHSRCVLRHPNYSRFIQELS